MSSDAARARDVAGSGGVAAGSAEVSRSPGDAAGVSIVMKTSRRRQ